MWAEGKLGHGGRQNPHGVVSNLSRKDTAQTFALSVPQLLCVKWQWSSRRLSLGCWIPNQVYGSALADLDSTVSGATLMPAFPEATVLIPLTDYGQIWPDMAVVAWKSRLWTFLQAACACLEKERYEPKHRWYWRGGGTSSVFPPFTSLQCFAKQHIYLYFSPSHCRRSVFWALGQSCGFLIPFEFTSCALAPFLSNTVSHRGSGRTK